MHIGMNHILRDEDILFLLPKEELALSRDTRKAVTGAIGKGRLRSFSEEERSYIVTKKGKEFSVYASPVSAGKLARRKNKED